MILPNHLLRPGAESDRRRRYTPGTRDIPRLKVHSEFVIHNRATPRRADDLWFRRSIAFRKSFERCARSFVVPLCHLKDTFSE